MYDYGEHVRKSPGNDDRFGIRWGEELLDGDEEEEPKKKPKSIRQYSSFYLHRRKYCLDDTVYLLSGDKDGPPHIGRIAKLHENIKDREKQMHVRWFCRPCELPEGLPDVDYSETCKEVFLMWGNGAKNINNPASTIRHCSVLCTAEEDWNRNAPSIEERAAADHIFDRAYDLRTGTLRSLDSIAKPYGEHLVIGTGGSRRAPSTRRSKSGKMTAGTRPPLDRQPLPLAMRASSVLAPLTLDWQCSGVSGLPALLTSPNTPSPIITPVGGQADNFRPKFSASALKTAREKSNEARLGTQDRMIPKAGNHGSKGPLAKILTNAGTVDSQKRPRVDRSDSSLPKKTRVRPDGSDLPSPGVSHERKISSIENRSADSHGNAVLKRERQKTMLNVSGKQKASEEKKRSRANSLDQRTETGKLKKPKFSIPSQAPDVALTKKVSKFEGNVSLSTAIGPKMGDLRSPKVPVRNLPENTSGSKQAHQSPRIKNEDGRVASAPVGASCSAANPKDENFSNLDQMGDQVQVSPRARSVKGENTGVLSPKVAKRSTTLSGKGLSDPKREGMCRAKKQSVKEENVGLSDPKRAEIQCLRKESIKEENVNVVPSSRNTGPIYLPDASSHQEVPDDLSPMHQNGARLKCTDLEQDTFGRSSAHGLGRCQSSMQGDVTEGNPILRKGQKLSTSNRVPAVEDVSPTSNKDWRLSEGNCNGIGEARGKHESSLSGKRAGSSWEDSRQPEVGSSHIASKKRPGSELEVGTRKSKTVRHSGPQPIQTEAQQACEELKVKKIGLVAKGVPRVSSKKQSDQTKSAETSRLPPQGLGKKVPKPLLMNHRISEPGKDSRAVQKDSRAAALDTTVAPPEEQGREIFEPKKKIFNFPWEDTLRIALEQGSALFLQNLDPWFASAEIEANLQGLLGVSCDVRILPPNFFTFYTSGQALVLFRTHEAAEEALVTFTENLLIWSKDERPVLASLADAKIAVGNRIHGFYNAELSSSRGVLTSREDQKNAVATSHCSQPNTVEYEMGIQWRLLQDRHTEALTIAAEDHKAAVDHPVVESKQRRP